MGRWLYRVAHARNTDYPEMPIPLQKRRDGVDFNEKQSFRCWIVMWKTGVSPFIPGAHKSNFPKPWGGHPDENPVLTPIPAKAGDAIIFTEGTNARGLSSMFLATRVGRSITVTVSVICPDWGGQGLHFSPNVMESLSETQQSILHLK